MLCREIVKHSRWFGFRSRRPVVHVDGDLDLWFLPHSCAQKARAQRPHLARREHGLATLGDDGYFSTDDATTVKTRGGIEHRRIDGTGDERIDPNDDVDVQSILCNGVLMHMYASQAKRTVVELNRVLANGGQLLLGVMHPLGYLFVADADRPRG